MKHKKESVLDHPQFRALDGGEAQAVIVDKIDVEFRKELARCLEGSNNFLAGDTYPAVAVDGVLKIKVLPNQQDPKPFLVNVHFILGTNIESAPDKLREEHGLEVLQPQKRPSGFVMNMVVKEKDDGKENGQREGHSGEGSGNVEGKAGTE